MEALQTFLVIISNHQYCHLVPFTKVGQYIENGNKNADHAVCLDLARIAKLPVFFEQKCQFKIV